MVATTGRRRLGLVTALTIASLLIGSTAMNALADHGRDGGGHGNGDQGKPGHAQVIQDQHRGGGNGNDQGGGNDNRGAGNDNAHANRASTTTSTETTTVAVAATTAMEPDADDLINQPAQETEEQRPGLGCGDDNHVHTGPPGNPGKQCRDHGDDGGMNAASDDGNSGGDDGGGSD
jgi:hypothetical protein